MWYCSTDRRHKIRKFRFATFHIKKLLIKVSVGKVNLRDNFKVFVEFKLIKIVFSYNTDHWN